MRKAIRSIVLFAAAALAVAPLVAGDYRDEALVRVAALERKHVGLAEAMPAENYAWRPMEGVRSVSELYLHVASANFRIPARLGTPTPEGFSGKGYEKSTTEKAQIVAEMKKSFAHLRTAVENLLPGDADKPVKMFGQETTLRGALWMTLEHLSEHLGQSIAYARTNKVVPPWNRNRS